MTIDERLEALTQSVELMAHMQRESEKLQQENEKRYAERFNRNEERLGQLMDTMNRLGNIVISHEQRLEDLEN
jgi:hypothetical protein